MKKLACIAILAMATSAHASFATAGDILEKLNGGDQSRLVAMGYIAGVFDTALGAVQCAPDGVTLKQVTDMARQYLTLDIDNRDKSADLVLLAMLVRVWPCVKKGVTL